MKKKSLRCSELWKVWASTVPWRLSILGLPLRTMWYGRSKGPEQWNKLNLNWVCFVDCCFKVKNEQSSSTLQGSFERGTFKGTVIQVGGATRDKLQNTGSYSTLPIMQLLRPLFQSHRRHYTPDLTGWLVLLVTNKLSSCVKLMECQNED